MKAMGRICLALLLVIAVLWWRDPALFDWIGEWRGETLDFRVSGTVVPGITYVLHDDQWVEFPLAGIGSTVRVLTNASIPDALSRQPDAEWHYALEYEVLDGAGGVLKKGVYHHFTKVTQFLDRSTPGRNAPFYGAYYLHSNFRPADGRVMVLDLAGRTTASRMRLRVAEKDEGLGDIVSRAYMRRRVSEYRLATSWTRIREAKREIMARGNIYPQDLLTSAEIESVLRNVWQPLGPVGVEGTDYVRRNIYTVEDVEAGEPEPSFVPPAGLFVTEGCRGVVPIPEGLHTLRLVLSDAGSPMYPAPEAVDLFWYGRAMTDRKQWRVEWPDDPPAQQGSSQSVTWEEEVEGGLLEVAPASAESPAAETDAGNRTMATVVRAALIEEGTERDITPEPIYLRAYTADAAKAVEFPVTHVGTRPTPFRIDLRGLETTSVAPSAPENGPATVAVGFLDASMQAIDTQEIAVDQPASPYDSITGSDEGASRVSEPAKTYFLLPASVAALRVQASRPVLVSAYDRPPDTAQDVLVPEDYYAYDEGNSRMPTWFPLLPRSFTGLLMERRAFLLTVQYRPPEDDPEILAGRYQWEAFQPEGVLGARRLLTVRAHAELAREESLPSTFVAIVHGVETELDVVGVTGLRTVQPSIIYVRDAATPADMTVWSDGTVLYKTSVAATRGKILLPSIEKGRHRLRVSIQSAESDAGQAVATRVFINYVNVVSRRGAGDHASRAYIERWAVVLEGGALTFPYEKATPGQEILSVDFFPSFRVRAQNVIRSRIEGPGPASAGPFAGRSFPERRYTVRVFGEDAEALPVLDTAGECVAPPERLFVVLDEDLPEGQYRVQLALEDGPGGYVLLSRTIPGLFPKRVFYIEGENDGDADMP